MSQQIKINTFVNADKERVWDCFTLPEHITQWNFAIPEWYCPNAKNDLREGGRFSYRMEAKDGSMGFDFSGTYTLVDTGKKLQFLLDDGREVAITFDEDGEGVLLTETFEAETQNPIEMQKQGWQAILHNFKLYVENQ